MPRSENQRRAGLRAKMLGHAAEARFAGYFTDEIHHPEYSGKKPDNKINDELAARLQSLGVSGRKVSTKSGFTFQIHLGDIPELSDKDYFRSTLIQKVVRGRLSSCGHHSVPFDHQSSILRSEEFWQKYLGKEADFLCYEVPNVGTFEFFPMTSVVSFLSKRVDWRLLQTGRIKGDIRSREGKLSAGVVTFEYREEKHQFNLGCNGSSRDGGNGVTLIRALRKEVPFVQVNPSR